MEQPLIIQAQAKPDFVIPAQEMVMSIAALLKTAKYILDNGGQFKTGDNFTLTDTKGKKVRMNLVK